MSEDQSGVDCEVPFDSLIYLRFKGFLNDLGKYSVQCMRPIFIGFIDLCRTCKYACALFLDPDILSSPPKSSSVALMSGYS
jgi:hypothetical protein